VVQDIYVKLRALDPAQPVKNEAAFLYRLGSNLMLDRLRQRRRGAARDGAWRTAHATLVQGQEVAEEPAADEALAQRHRYAKMLAAIDELPPQHRQALILHKLEGLNQVDTARALGVSLSSVEKYLRASLKHLAERLGPGQLGGGVES
jgi:RNA polymerase sigma-70 factor (ECF subfamily)